MASGPELRRQARNRGGQDRVGYNVWVLAVLVEMFDVYAISDGNGFIQVEVIPIK